MPSCDGDPTTNSTKECAVFVRGDVTDTDGPDAGTPENPFKTLQAAIDVVPANRWIVVCKKNTFTEKVTIAKDNVAIYGGFDCDNGWTWKEDQRSTLQGLPDTIALTVRGRKAKVENFIIRAADATKPGGSSIAALVKAADPTFNRCEMFANVPKPGVDGIDAPPTAAQAGATGKKGGNACSKDTVVGAAQVVSMCPPVATVSVGGGGGDGTAFNGNPGASGQPSYGGGQAGQGEPSNNPSWSCGVNNGNGHDGLQGNSGAAGSPPTGDLKLGTFDDVKDLFNPEPGKDGTPGQPGQGGGGGGGVKGGAACVAATKGGASGGSGGTGGCGGTAGKGGQGGGASIALIILNSSIMNSTTLKKVTLTAVDGAKAGSGGDAQAGGSGATGGSGGSNLGIFGVKDGCSGGAGGRGGDGGPGAGGRGGHSLGLIYTGIAPTMGDTIIVVGKGGAGGIGGNNDLFKNKGDDGKALKLPVLLP
jgi:hypothetical protein